MEGVGSGDVAHQDLVGVGAIGVAKESEAAGGVGLGVAVDEEGWGLVRRERRGEVDGGGRLADSALLVGDRDDSCHVSPSCPAAAATLGLDNSLEREMARRQRESLARYHFFEEKL